MTNVKKFLSCLLDFFYSKETNMLKKIVLALAVVASSSFATYNYFPVGEAGKGQVEVGLAHQWGDGWSTTALGLKGEYVVIPNLELAIMGIGYQFGDADGFTAMTLGARYQFMPMLIAAVDVALPLNSEDVAPYDPFGLYFAIQYTQEFMPNLALGSELGFDWKFEDEDLEEGLMMTLQAELDYTIASIGLTPWVGLEYDQQLSDNQVKGHKTNGSGDNGISFWVGAGYDINAMLSVKANLVISRGDFGDSQEINAALDINF